MQTSLISALYLQLVEPFDIWSSRAHAKNIDNEKLFDSIHTSKIQVNAFGVDSSRGWKTMENLCDSVFRVMVEGRFELRV